MYNDKDTDFKQLLLEEEESIKPEKSNEYMKNNTLSLLACIFALFAFVMSSMAVHNTNNDILIINNIITPDCLSIKSEIYNSEFCSSNIKPYSNESNIRKNMCTELAQGICEVTDEFFKSKLKQDQYLNIDPCRDSIYNIEDLSKTNSIATSNNAFTLRGNSININETGHKNIGDQELVDWDSDCKTISQASYSNCFDICLTDTKVKGGITISMRPSDKCCEKDRKRSNNDWSQQIEADLSPSDELKKAICKYAPTIINYLGDKGADWICSKGESIAANMACNALLDSIDIGWIPDVDSLCAELLEDALNDLGLESECDKYAEEGMDYITNIIDNELTSYIC
jgi:hypothetical protein